MPIKLHDFRGKVKNLFCDTLQKNISEKEVDALIEFMEKVSLKENNCFEFISNIFVKDYDNESYVGMTVFIEPIGYITLYGHSFKNVLNGWKEILLKQPNEMNYKEAGFFIQNKNQSFLDIDERKINIVNKNTNLQNYWV